MTTTPPNTSENPTTTNPPPHTTTTTEPSTAATEPSTTTTESHTTTSLPPTTTSTHATTSLPSTTTSTHTVTPPTTSTSSGSQPMITPTSSANPIISPTLPPSEETSSGLSGGAIAGIVIAAVVVFIAALVAAFLIKRRHRRHLDRTSNTMFNPVNLDMQENRHQHPRSDIQPSSPSMDHGGGSGSAGVVSALSERGSAEPLNAAMMGASGFSAASSGGLNHQDTLYPCEVDPQYLHSGTYTAGVDGVNYVNPSEAAYGVYSGGYGQYGNEEAAYYQEQLYQQQLQQHERDMRAAASYYNPGSSGMYYPEQSYVDEEAMRQQHLYMSQSGPMAPVPSVTTPMAPNPDIGMEEPEQADSTRAGFSSMATRRASETDPTARSTYVDAESDAHKTELRPEHRQSMASTSSQQSAHTQKRNPQLMTEESTTSLKVPVPDNDTTPM
ncbi:hypothetical protein BGZ58_005536 [Dissophora ornata]|nr:hypothetical protein BGZ58_005536 [Dissophora ornata]